MAEKVDGGCLVFRYEVVNSLVGQRHLPETLAILDGHGAGCPKCRDWMRNAGWTLVNKSRALDPGLLQGQDGLFSARVVTAS